MIRLFRNAPFLHPRVSRRKSPTPGVLRPRVLFALLLLFIQASCSSAPVRTELPAAEKFDYSPIKVFALDFSSAWETTLRGLQEKGVPVGTQDREKGIIRTNFQDGSEMRHLGKIYSSRYKYNIFLFREGDRKTILNLRCQFEGKEKGGTVFFDGSYLFPGQVAALENRMYQAIESYLLPLQASRGAETGTGGQQAAKQVSPIPAPAEQVPPPKPAPPQGPLPPPSAPGLPPSPKDQGLPPNPPAEARLAAKSPSAGAAPAVQPKAAKFGTFVTKREANLREGPSLKSKIILRLKKGTKLQKVGQSSTWTKVKVWEKTVGYVSQELLQEIP